MKRIKKLSLLLISVVLFLSCNQLDKHTEVNTSESKVIDVNINDSQSEANLSNVIESFEYVPLETTDNSLIGTPYGIRANSEYIITYHQASIHSVTIFKRDGEFVEKIEIEEGSGPGQLYYPSYFDVNFQNEEIALIGYRKLNLYSFEGDLIKEITLDFHPKALSHDGENFIFSMGNTLFQDLNDAKSNILVTDRNGGLKATFLPIEEEKAGITMSTSSTYTKYNGKTLFSDYPGYKIYSMNSDSINLRYELNFGDGNIPREKYNERGMDEIAGNQGFPFLERIFDSEYIGPVSNFYEFENHISFSFNLDRMNRYTLFFSKETGNYKLSNNWVNDLDGGKTPFFYSKDDDYLIAITEPLDLFEHAENLNVEESELKSNILDVLSNIQESDNPIVIFAKLRN